jgi:hypothetical protein
MRRDISGCVAILRGLSRSPPVGREVAISVAMFANLSQYSEMRLNPWKCVAVFLDASRYPGNCRDVAGFAVMSADPSQI